MQFVLLLTCLRILTQSQLQSGWTRIPYSPTQRMTNFAKRKKRKPVGRTLQRSEWLLSSRWCPDCERPGSRRCPLAPLPEPSRTRKRGRAGTSCSAKHGKAHNCFPAFRRKRGESVTKTSHENDDLPVFNHLVGDPCLGSRSETSNPPPVGANSRGMQMRPEGVQSMLPLDETNYCITKWKILVRSYSITSREIPDTSVSFL